MKRAYTIFLLVTAVCVTVSAAQAGDFRLISTVTGANQHTYTLTNLSTTIDVVEWTLHWNPNDWMDDLNKGMANFDSDTGIVPPIPNMWYQIAAVFPWFSTGTVQTAIKRNGGSLGGFTVKYGTPSNPNPVLPGWFTIAYVDGPTRRTSEMMPITEQIIPEPGSLLALALGLTAFAGRFRRRTF